MGRTDMEEQIHKREIGRGTPREANQARGKAKMAKEEEEEEPRVPLPEIALSAESMDIAPSNVLRSVV